VFIVEMTTAAGRLCESYATYEEARHRVEQFSADSLVGIPLIFQELADGSQRLVREDGKPLQWHRLPEDVPPRGPDEPVPLCDDSSDLLGEGKWVLLPQPEPQDEPSDDGP
jgi:hypothetical protein